MGSCSGLSQAWLITALVSFWLTHSFPVLGLSSSVSQPMLVHMWLDSGSHSSKSGRAWGLQRSRLWTLIVPLLTQWCYQSKSQRLGEVASWWEELHSIVATFAICHNFCLKFAAVYCPQRTYFKLFLLFSLDQDIVLPIPCFLYIWKLLPPEISMPNLIFEQFCEV